MAAAPLILFALDPAPAAGTALCFVAGLGVAYLLGLQRRLLQAVPEANRGQAFGLVFTGMSTLQGVTMVIAGALADIWTPSTVVALFGTATTLSAIALAKYLRPPHTAAPTAHASIPAAVTTRHTSEQPRPEKPSQRTS